MRTMSVKAVSRACALLGRDTDRFSDKAANCDFRTRHEAILMP